MILMLRALELADVCHSGPSLTFAVFVSEQVLLRTADSEKRCEHSDF